LARKVKDCIVRNCVFNNISFAIGSLAGIRCQIYNNTITNLKSCTDTSGTFDVGGGAFEAVNGYYNQIYNNTVKGAWCKSGRISSTQGLMGVGCDVFNLKYSSIKYNTFIDCSGAIEVGNIDNVSLNSGAQYDTIAYNKVINCGQLIYMHGTGTFGGYIRNIYLYNNIVIDNNKSRIVGPNFGGDLYGDGQSFSGNREGNYSWWFFRSPTKCTGKTTVTGSIVSGSNIMTIATTGIFVGTQIYNQATLNDYRTVTAIGSGQVTVDAPWNYTGSLPFQIFPLTTDNNYSFPENPPYCNYGGYRQTAQYSLPVRDNPDTVIDSKNNIFYSTVGGQMIYDVTRTNYKHSYNIYYIKGGFLNPTALGGTLGTGEKIIQTKIFKDTSDAFPENWDLRLVDTSSLIGAGSTISGLTKDFAGIPLSGATDIGLYKYSAKPMLALSSSTNVTCKTATNGTVTVTASGGTGPYLYKMNNGAWQSSSSFSNLAAGTYIITVKDAKGATSTLTVIIKGSNSIC